MQADKLIAPRKAAVVTGAGSRPGEGVGNGRAAAILLARAGARVVLADTQAEWAEDTRRMIAEEGAGEGVVAVGDACSSTRRTSSATSPPSPRKSSAAIRLNSSRGFWRARERRWMPSRTAAIRFRWSAHARSS